MRHDFEDGKYTVINDNGNLVALRHGEQWRDLNGDKLVCSMLLEVDALKAQRDELLEACKEAEWNSLHLPESVRIKLEAVIKKAEEV